MDVQTLFNLEHTEEVSANPWLNRLFNTCQIDPLPDNDERLGISNVEETEASDTATTRVSDCNWTLVGIDLYNNNQDGQVLIGTKRPSAYLPRTVMTKAGDPGTNTNFLEFENKSNGTDMIGTRSSMIWTMFYPDNDQSQLIGRFGCGMESEWTLTSYTDWQYVGQWGELADFGNPIHMTTDGQYWYVISKSIPGLSGGGDGICKINPFDSTLVTSVGGAGSGLAQFNFSDASEIRYYNGRLYVSDSNNDRIKVYDPQTMLCVALVGSTGSGDGQLNDPAGLYVDSTGIYVTEQANDRIQHFNLTTYAYVKKAGSSGTGDGQFTVAGTCCSDGTYLWVADNSAERIQKFLLSDLSFVAKYLTIGSDPLDRINDMIFHNGNVYYATNSYSGSGNGKRFVKLDKDLVEISASGVIGSTYADAEMICPWGQYLVVSLYRLAITDPQLLFTYFYDTSQTDYYTADGYFFWELTHDSLCRPLMRLTADGYLLVGKTSGSERVDINGNYKTNGQFISTYPTGTKPIDVTSTTLCTNLNADYLDGHHWTDVYHTLLEATYHTDTLTTTPTLGALIYGNVTPKWTKLLGHTNADKRYLSQTGTGVVSAVPSWSRIDHGGDIDGLSDNDHPQYLLVAVPAVAKHYTGFWNRTGSAITYGGTRTLTLTWNSDKQIYINGLVYTVATDTAQHTTADGLHYFYYDLVAGVPDLLVATSHPGFDKCLVAIVYWNNTTGAALVGDERHWFGRDQWWHEWAHETMGARFASGLAGTFATGSFSIGVGEFYDEDIEHEITPAKTACDILYKDGSAVYSWDTNQTVLYKLNGSVLRYNNGTALADVPVSNYVVYWVYITNSTTRSVVSLMGQRVDTTLANARANNTPESLSLGTLPFAEMKLIYRVIFRQTGAATYAYIEATDYRTVSPVPTGAYVSTSHASLTGLAWTVSGHYMDGALDMLSNLINNVTDPSGAQDAATKNYVDTRALDDLADVDAAAPDDGDVLTWDSGTATWIAAPSGAGGLDLDDLGDVDAPTPNNGDALIYNSGTGNWEAAAPGVGALALDDLSDVDAAAPNDGDVLTWDSGDSAWEAIAPAGADHDLLSATHLDTTASAVARGDLIAGIGASPTWTALALGTEGYYLRAGADEPAWAAIAWSEVSKVGSILDDIADCVFTSTAQGDIIYRNGSNQWVNLAKGTETWGRQKYLRTGSTPSWATLVEYDHQWLDDFADASIYFSWWQWNTGASKTITESGSVVTLAVTALQNSRWYGSAATVLALYTPSPWHGNFTFEVLMNDYTVNDDTMGGIFISNFMGSTTAAYGIGRLRDDGTGPIDGLVVWQASSSDGQGTILASNAVTTLPIYLRLNVGGYQYYHEIVQFQYSTDGASWTTLYTLATTTTAAAQYNHQCGLMTRNWGATYGAITVPFDYARFYQDFGPG